jgi:hypothetical protein
MANTASDQGTHVALVVLQSFESRAVGTTARYPHSSLRVAGWAPGQVTIAFPVSVLTVATVTPLASLMAALLPPVSNSRS